MDRDTGDMSLVILSLIPGHHKVSGQMTLVTRGLDHRSFMGQ